MASFVDNITSFTPYISEVPTEVLLNVGLSKQSQFDAGLQKEQQTIDAIAGLPLAKDVTQNYLKGKLGQLKQSVSQSISSDLSDMRLQNQLGGMTRAIGSDPIIQKGVQNTLRMQGEDARMNKAIADGKSSIENEAYYQAKRSKWLTDGSLDSDFTANYYEYIDLNKKWFDVIKALGADSSIEQNPYVKNPDGSINFNKVAAAMTEQGVKGIDASKIENAIRATMTEADNNQLRISGWNRFRNYTRDDLANKFKADYDASISETRAQIDKLKQIAATATSDTATYNQLKKIIQQKEDSIKEGGSIQGRYLSQLDALKSDPTEDGEYAKMQLYKDGYIQQFSKAFSWEEKYLKYLTNPIQEQNNWEKDYALRQSANARGWAELQETIRQHGIENQFKKQELDAKNAVFQPFVTERETQTDIPSATIAMRQEMDDSAKQATSLVEQVRQRMLVNGEPINKDILYNKIEAYRNGDKNQIPVDLRGLVDQAIGAKNNADFIQATIERKTKEIQSLPQFKQSQQDINTALAQRGNLNVHTNGQTYTFTPKEIFDFVNKRQLKSRSNPYGGMQDYVEYSSPLSPKEQVLANNIEKAKGKDYNFYSGLISSYQGLKEQSGKAAQDFSVKLEQSLLPLAGRWNPYTLNLDALDTKTRELIEGKYAAVAQRYIEGKGAAQTFRKDDQATLQEMLYGKNSEKTKYRTILQGNTAYLEATNGDANVIIPMTPMEAAQIKASVNVPNYNLNLDETINMGGGTTNPTDDPTKARYNKGYFDSRNKLNFTADVKDDASNNNIKYPRLHLLTPDGWKSITVEAPMDNINVEQYLKSLTDKTVKDKFIQHFTEAGDLSTAELIKNMK